MLDLMAPVKQPARKHYIAHPISSRSFELRALTFNKTSVKACGTPGHTARVGSDLEKGGQNISTMRILVDYVP